MDITSLLGVVASVAVAVERATELTKPVYLKLKSKVLKKDLQECTRVEKSFMSMLLGSAICLLTQIGVDIPGVNETSPVREILAGLLSSFGSNVLHTVLSILTGIKDSTEANTARKRQ